MVSTPLRYILDEAVAAEVRSEVHRTGTTLEELSAATGLSHTTIQQKLSGQISFSVSEISSMAVTLGTTGSDLIARAELGIATQAASDVQDTSLAAPADELEPAEQAEGVECEAHRAPTSQVPVDQVPAGQASANKQALEDFIAHVDRRLNEASTRSHSQEY